MSDKIKLFSVRVNGQWHCPEFRYNFNFGLRDELHQSSFVVDRKIAARRVKEKVRDITTQLKKWSGHANTQQQADWCQHLENWTNAEIVEWDLNEVPK